MAPEQDGPFAPILERGSPDVEHQAVFTLGGDARMGACRIALRRARTVVQCVTNAGPRRWVHRRYEAILPRRSCSVRNTLTDFDALHFFAADLAECCLGDDEVLTALPARK